MSAVLGFLLALGVLVVVHEYGHYRVARACGVKVLRFSVGFGKVLWRRQRGDTEFVVSLLPLGGYVRMLDERVETVDEKDLHLTFDHKPLWQRAAVVAAGPLANLLLAVVLLAAVNWIGKQEPLPVVGTPVAGSITELAGVRAGDWITAVSRDGTHWDEMDSWRELRLQVLQAADEGQALHLRISDKQGARLRTVVLPLADLARTKLDASTVQRIGLGAPYSEPVLERIEPGSAADRAGLQAGDRIVRVDGRAMADAAELRNAILASVRDGQPASMRWEVERQGQMLEKTVQAEMRAEGGRVGVVMGNQAETALVRLGPVEGLVMAAQQTWDMTALSLKLFARMVTRMSGFENLTGPIGMTQFAGDAADKGLVHFLFFMAVISVGLGVLNLLPVPMLDGGHLMYFLFEGVTGRPVSELWQKRFQFSGIAFILTLTGVALVNDLRALFG